MRKLFLYICVFVGLGLFPVTSFAKKQPPQTADSIEPGTIIPDTSVIYKPSEITFNPNLDGLIRYQEEQRAKQKKAAMIRVGIGVFFLMVLIVGLSRRRKK